MWTRHVARMGEKRNAYRLLVERPLNFRTVITSFLIGHLTSLQHFAVDCIRSYRVGEFKLCSCLYKTPDGSL
jgi:hypothetical protein